MSIIPTDLISGAQYLRFLANYKKHDMIQRERIAVLESENNIQKLEIEWLHTVIDESDANISKKMIDKIKRQSILLHEQGMKIYKSPFHNLC